MTDFYLSNAGSDAAPINTLTSPWRTWTRIATAMLDGTFRDGDRVFYNRGGDFHEAVVVPDPFTGAVVVSAYGVGPKPKIDGYKYLNIASGWTEHAAGVWKIDVSAATAGTSYTGHITSSSANIGHLAINGATRARITSATLAALGPAQWDFYSDGAKWLYVRSAANPTTLASSIAAAPRTTLIQARSNIDVSELEIFGSGAHGVRVQGGESPEGISVNVIVRYCVVHDVGGSAIGAVVIGNGMEVWESSDGVWLHHNEIFNVFDVALTAQGNASAAGRGIRNVFAEHNDIHDCTQAFEFWHRNTAGYAGVGSASVKFNHNVVRNSGRSWGYEARTDKTKRADVLVYSVSTATVDVEVAYNSFHDAQQHFYCDDTDRGTKLPPAGVRLHHNRIYLRQDRMLDYFTSKPGGSSKYLAVDFEAWRAATGLEKDSTLVVLPRTFDGEVKNLQQLIRAEAARANDVAQLGLTFAQPTPRAGRTPLLPARPSGTFAVVGDSQSATADTTTNKGLLSEMPQSGKWPVLLNLLSNGQLEFMGAVGASGQTSEQLLNGYFPTLLKANPVPSMVLFMLGGNDSAAYGVRKTIANLAIMCDQVVARGSHPIICTNFPDGSGTPERQQRVLLNTALRAFASERRYHLLDAYEAMVDPLTSNTRAGFVEADNLHLNNAGQLDWAAKATAKLLQIVNLAGGYFRTSTGDAGDLLVGAGLFGADANGDGLADGWELRGTAGDGTIQRQSLSTGPLAGFWVQRALQTSAGAGTVGVKKLVTAPAGGYVAGHLFEVAGWVETAGFTAQQALALPSGATLHPSHALVARFRSGADGTGTLLAEVGYGRPTVDVSGFFRCRVRLPEGVQSCTIEATVQRPAPNADASAATVWARFGRVSLRDLTAANLGISAY